MQIPLLTLNLTQFLKIQKIENEPNLTHFRNQPLNPEALNLKPPYAIRGVKNRVQPHP